MRTVLLNYLPSPEHRTELEAAAPGWRLIAAGSEEDALRAAPEAEAILGNRYFLQALPGAQRLRWMQSNSVGMDLILANTLAREREFVLTNARGVYDDELADHALALALALTRGVGRAVRSLADGGWERESLPVLRELPALVVGGCWRSGARLPRCDAAAEARQRRSPRRWGFAASPLTTCRLLLPKAGWSSWRSR